LWLAALTSAPELTEELRDLRREQSLILEA
jgi:hypothetical protein